MEPHANGVVDVLGEPFYAETIPLPPDDEGEVVATLVQRRTDAPSGRAVLYVHGFVDYFFHTELAEWWTARGYHFYAIDLRKHGRSVRDHHTLCFVTDLREHHVELDAAWQRITQRDGHTHVTVVAHSTGGLIASLWLHRRQPRELAGAVLNSPWLEHAGHPVKRTLETLAVQVIGARWARREVRRGGTPSVYAHTLHPEWSFNPRWKPLINQAVLAGWFKAVRAGHAEVHRGLTLAAPVLVLTSDRTGSPVLSSPDVHTSDLVLDVHAIRRWAPALGPHVTSVTIPDARHDVYLSQPAPRTHAYAETDRWRTAYLP